MKKLLITLVLSVIIAFTGCSTLSVSYDFDSEADFTKLKKYDLLPVTKQSEVDELIMKRIENAINRNLNAKNFVQNPDSPDFVVVIHVSSQDKWEVVSWSFPDGRYGGYNRYWNDHRVDVYEYNEGTIMIDILDASSKKLIWRGTGRGMVKPGLSPQARDERIGNAVSDLLKDFPPVSKE